MQVPFPIPGVLLMCHKACLCHPESKKAGARSCVSLPCLLQALGTGELCWLSSASTSVWVYVGRARRKQREIFWEWECGWNYGWLRSRRWGQHSSLRQHKTAPGCSVLLRFVPLISQIWGDPLGLLLHYQCNGKSFLLPQDSTASVPNLHGMQHRLQTN